MRLIDIHSHILPEMDDGAKNIEESKKLLKMLKDQGIDLVVATPHFYPMDMNLEDFIEKRRAKIEYLESETKGQGFPRIFRGAEVYYFTGIGKSELIKTLAIENTNYLLLEIPLENITDSLLNDIRDIRENLKLLPIIAHIERYAKVKRFKHLLKLIDEGVCMAQVNTSSVIKRSLRKTSKNLLKRGYISFIASDAHSSEHRPPHFDEAFLEIQTTMETPVYQGLLSHFEKFSNEILKETENGK